MFADRRARLEEAEGIMGRALKHLLHHTERLQSSLFHEIRVQTTAAILRAIWTQQHPLFHLCTHAKSPQRKCRLHSDWNPDVISLGEGLRWFTETITGSSISPMRARKSPYAVEMRRFKKSNLDEETEILRETVRLFSQMWHWLQAFFKTNVRDIGGMGQPEVAECENKKWFSCNYRRNWITRGRWPEQIVRLMQSNASGKYSLSHLWPR